MVSIIAFSGSGIYARILLHVRKDHVRFTAVVENPVLLMIYTEERPLCVYVGTCTTVNKETC